MSAGAAGMTVGAVVIYSDGMDLPPFRLERWFARYEFQARWLLGSSDCESWSIEELLALEPGADEQFLRLRLGYTESAGSPSLRQAICGLYRTIEPDQVLVHAAAEEAIFLFMHAAPARPATTSSSKRPATSRWPKWPRGIGCRVTPWPAAGGGGAGRRMSRSCGASSGRGRRRSC